jgi:signal transduction histidine kinase
MFAWLSTSLKSTITRFVILAFLFQLLVTAGALFFAQQQSQNVLAAEQKQWVGELRRELLDAEAAGGRAGLTAAIQQRLAAVRGDLAVILLTTADDKVIAGNLGAWPPVVPDQTPWREIDLYRVGNDRPEHMGVSSMLLPDGSQLLTGQVIDAGVRLQQVDAEAMAAAFLIGLLLAMLGAVLLAQLLSRRIDHIVRTTAAISDGALAERVPVTGSGDAFDALGGAINTMLDRIQSLVSELRLTTDGLAHDLRSPVTRLKAALDRAMLETEDPVAVAALESVASESEALLDMLSTALLISRTQAGIGREQLHAIDVQAFLLDLSEVYGPLAEDQDFTIAVEAEPGLTLNLHRQLASQAIGNLIENALRYAEGGKQITLSAARKGETVELAVADDGPGIPPDRHAEALRRFGRLDPSRHSGGSGLGLSLVEAVARLHGGEVALEDNRPGLRVVLRLPVLAM